MVCSLTPIPVAGSVHYTITRSPHSHQVIRYRYIHAIEKARAAYNLPTGVSISQMAELWEAMNFGNVDPSAAPFDPAMFKKPTEDVKALRKLSKLGREHLASEAKTHPGVEQVVWKPRTARPVRPMRRRHNLRSDPSQVAQSSPGAGVITAASEPLSKLTDPGKALQQVEPTPTVLKSKTTTSDLETSSNSHPSTTRED